MILIGGLKVFIEPSNKYVEFVDLWGFMVRDSQAIKTRIFCSLQAFVCLEKMRSENIISHWYELQRNLFTLVVRDYIVEILPMLVLLNTYV
jgi:hypothetical protein